MDADAVACHLRREAVQKRHEAEAAVDADEFDLAAMLRREADVLLDRADEVSSVRRAAA